MIFSKFLKILFVITVFHALPAQTVGAVDFSTEESDDTLPTSPLGPHCSMEEMSHHFHDNLHPPATKIMPDEDEEKIAHSTKGQRFGEFVGIVAPATRYGLLALCGVGFTVFIAGSGGIAAIPIVFLLPLVTAGTKKLSDFVVRAGVLALESDPEASTAYCETLKNKGYDTALRLPFEDTVVGGIKKIHKTVKKGLDWAHSFFPQLSS